MTVSPSPIYIIVGAIARVTARALNQSGSQVAGATLAYSSSAPTVATVDQEGLVTGVSPGTAQMTVSSGGVSTVAQITVSPRTVARIVVTPTATTLMAGATAQLTVQALDDANAPVPEAVVSFTSSALPIATVTQGGLVTGIAPGTAQVTVSSQGASALASVTVTPRPVSQITLTPSTLTLMAGATQQLTAQALDNTGNPVAGAVVAFATNAATVAIVTQGGLVSAVAPGSAQITASSQGVSVVASVIVTPRSVAQVTLNPSSLSLVAGASAQLTPLAVDNTGTPVVGAVVTYGSSATAIATVTQSGFVTAVAPGTAQITATSQGVNGVATVTVSARPVTQVTLTPSSLAIAAGTTAQLTAQARDNTGALVSGALITFASDATAVATVNQSGLVAGVAPGSTTIRATSNGITATTALTVQTAGLAIDVTPGISYQTISGWEATSQIGEHGCSSYQIYGSTLLDRAVNELGINRMRLEIVSSVENPTDYFAQLLSGQISRGTYNIIAIRADQRQRRPLHGQSSGVQVDLPGLFSRRNH
ncbi:MAG: Ig-like domain-containing protein [Gemmatimonadaceae bacterium]|nr:Ig-like domain-containing protein [Gemmatimonadaceae bacterium]